MALVDEKYARDIALPLQFTEDCDLEVDENEEVIDQALQLISLSLRGSIPLWIAFGSTATDSVFDPLDDETELQLDSALRQSIEALEPRVFLDREFTYDEAEDEHKLIIILPYKIVITGEFAASRLVISRPVS